MPNHTCLRNQLCFEQTKAKSQNSKLKKKRKNKNKQNNTAFYSINRQLEQDKIEHNLMEPKFKQSNTSTNNAYVWSIGPNFRRATLNKNVKHWDVRISRATTTWTNSIVLWSRAQIDVSGAVCISDWPRGRDHRHSLGRPPWEMISTNYLARSFPIPSLQSTPPLCV